jgi:signal transduction histidine kinase
MKLLHQTQRLFLWTATPLFVLSGFVMFFSLQWTIRYFAEEQLSGVQQEIEAYVRAHDTLPVYFQSIDNQLYARPIPSNTTLIPYCGDTLILNPYENEWEPYYCLHFPVRVRGQVHELTLLQSALENEDLAFTVFVLFGALFVTLLGALIWVNRRVSGRVWQPFFNTLDQVHHFRLSDATPLLLNPTSVDEFKELHRSLLELTEKVRQDFRVVQQFSENASHELQTPLAVVQNKLENLLQDGSLTEAHLQQLNQIQQSVRRMARLNKNLLLLTKIENNQFSPTETLDLAALLEKRLDAFDDFIQARSLVVKKSLQSVQMQANGFLVETVFSNLLGNAIKHNQEGGRLEIVLSPQKLRISNSGAAPNMPLERLKQRFVRGNTNTDGQGLGLALVEEICDKYHWRVELGYAAGIWVLDLNF